MVAMQQKGIQKNLSLSKQIACQLSLLASSQPLIICCLQKHPSVFACFTSNTYPSQFMEMTASVSLLPPKKCEANTL